MKRPTTSELVRALDRAGIRYHTTGTLTRNGKKYGEFYKTDRITPEQIETLKAQFGRWIETAKTRAEYAPEQIRPIIIHRSAGALTPAAH